MFRYVFALLVSLIGGYVNAHQFLPTYPTFQSSFIEGVVYTKMQLFNKRKDVEFYELGVFDNEWNPISFASESKLIRVNYLETKDVNVYIKKEELKRIVYICTESKLKKQEVQNTVISSKICSKVK
jgi:hypothetical protein